MGDINNYGLLEATDPAEYEPYAGQPIRPELVAILHSLNADPGLMFTFPQFVNVIGDAVLLNIQATITASVSQIDQAQ